MPLMPVPLRSVQTPMGPVTYYRLGDGPPVVLLHGLGGAAVVWYRVAPLLARRWTVYAVDLWHPERVIPSGRYGLADAASFLTGFLDAVGCPAAHVCGSSLGGLIAAYTASVSPDRVHGLVLAAPAGLGREAGLSLRLMAVPVVGDLLFRPSRRRVHRLIELLTRGSVPIDDALVDELYRGRLAPGVSAQMLRALRSGISLLGTRKEIFLVPHLPRIAAPTLLLWGERDPLFPTAHGQRALELMPNARLHVFPQGGHWPYLERPEDFSQVVAGFLDAVSSGPRGLPA